MESALWEQTYDELIELSANKLDLNSCSREDLERLPFLSGQQVMDIIEYRDRYGRMETGMGLRMIRSLDTSTADLLLQFVTIGPAADSDTIPSLRSLMRHARHEAVGYMKMPLYDRAGDKDGYLGSKYKHWLRYTLSSSQHLKVGFVASQDAGEP